MANVELNNIRLSLCNKTEAEWANYDVVILKGELAISSDKRKIKIGNGVDVWANLPYANVTPEEVQTLITASSHTHSNKAVLDATTASFTTALLTKLNGIAEGANKTVVDSALSGTSTNPVQNKVIKAKLDADLATAKSYTDTKIADLIDTAPETMDTLGELADAIKAHQNVTDALNAAIGKKANASDLTAHTGNTGIHVTSTEKTNWNAAYTHSQAAHAPSNAERNVIVGIQKNGTDITPDSTTRKVNITVPTKTSEITNDSGYLTSSGTIAKANQFTTARAIDGVNFNGTTAITHYGTCATEAATAAKVVSLSDFTLVTGSRVSVKFTVTNTASAPTLNVNGTGAKAVTYRGSAVSAGILAANRVYEFVYDGTNWCLVGDLDTNTTYSAGAGLTLSGNQFKHSNSVTAGTASGDANKTLAFGGTFTVPSVTYDAQGHITGASKTTMTMPAAPTTITGNAGSATKLATARNFSITGAVTAAKQSFDGTKDIVLNATAVNAATLYLNSGDTLILNGNF